MFIMILGITGVFGSGKTTVAKMFAEHGYLHVNADEIGHMLLDRGEVKGRVVQEFGESIIVADKIDRRKSASNVIVQILEIQDSE